MKRVTDEFKQEFISGLNAMFPDVVTSGLVSNAQITEYMKKTKDKKWPTWLTRPDARASRGVYFITAQKKSNVVPMNVPKPVAVVQSTDTKPLVPVKDPAFVPFGIYKDVETIVKSRQFYPVYIYGPTGNGKSTAVEQACAKLKTPMIRVNLNMMTDEDQLIGTKTLVDGNIEIVEGPVLIAMRAGIPLLLDELDAGSANTLLCLQPILEGKPYFFKLKNELIIPAEGFNVFATGNTKGKGSDDGRYIGTNILNEAFLERFAITLTQDYPSTGVERKIVENIMGQYDCYDEDFATSLVKWADAIRRTFNDGGIDESVTTRRLIHIVRAFSIFKNKTKAIELCTNRFDEVTRQAFINLFEKVSTDPDSDLLASNESATVIINDGIDDGDTL